MKKEINERLKESCVPIHHAIEKCDNWRQTFSNLFQPARSEDILRSFRIPIEDIRSLAAINEAVAVRAYFAIDQVDNLDTLRLMIVPIVADETHAGGEKDVLFGAGAAPDDTYIFDFTQPCPMLCDKASLLYGPEEVTEAAE